MNTVPDLDAAAVLRRHGIKPTKKLGQNFLQDPEALQRIADVADLRDSDTVLEIGAGLGSLTRYLALRAHRVVAVDVDERLIPIARKILTDRPNVELIAGDILSHSPAELSLPPGYVVAANIPYNITSPILRHVLEADLKPRRMVLTVQAEVAERICARPPDMSVLALSVQVFGIAEIMARIPAAAFFPVPAVDSAVVRVDLYGQPLIAARFQPTFFRLIRAGFSQKRKMLRNSLASGLRISASRAVELLVLAEIEPRLRAEVLDIADWQRLCAATEAAVAET
jgi:16S rRNA (adenine1518-N6/adenine1519-N6)-dimethyltransferase